MQAAATAWVVSAVLFIPERSPTVDVYGKVGVAELDESLETRHFNHTLGECIPSSTCPYYSQESNLSESDSRPYFGIGGRFEVARTIAMRVEYEAIDRDTGDDTTMLSFGVSFER